MVDYIFKRNYFGRNYNFYQVDVEKNIDIQNFKRKGIDGIIALINNEENHYSHIKNICKYTDLRGLSIEGIYDSLDELSEFQALEYLSINVKCKKKIPLESLKNLWCVYLNYDKKNTNSIFDCRNLEYIFIQNYKELDASLFKNFSRAKRIGLKQTNILSFPLDKIPNLEHLGICYNLKLEDIEWLNTKNNLKSLAFANCKNIKNWEVISTLKNLEYLNIENCKEIPSLAFLSILKNLKEVRVIGNTTIMDGKIKDLLNLPNLQEFFLPIRKEYDLTFKEYTHWKNKMLPLEE